MKAQNNLVYITNKRAQERERAQMYVSKEQELFAMANRAYDIKWSAHGKTDHKKKAEKEMKCSQQFMVLMAITVFCFLCFVAEMKGII